MDSKEFLRSYLNDFSNLVKPNKDVVHKLVKVADLLNDVKAEGKKILIFGNGGSAAIASHFSVDLTKNASLRCINCNEADLITCFANDYGFEHWVEKALGCFADECDLLVLVSSSGESANIVNGARRAVGMGLPILTLSGFASDNTLRSLGGIHLWVDSRTYNIVENVHQIWMLSIVDYLVADKDRGLEIPSEGIDG